MANLEIREEIKKSRLFHYEIADGLEVSESAFSKWLRFEMDADRKEKVMRAIESIKGCKWIKKIKQYFLKDF